MRDPIAETYWLWKLESEDPAQRDAAAAKLGKMHSVRAIPRLVAMFRTAPERPEKVTREEFRAIAGRDDLPYEAQLYMHHVSGRALVEIGRPAIPALVELLQSEEELSVSNALGDRLGWTKNGSAVCPVDHPLAARSSRIAIRSIPR